jgi:hypothetical protein
MHPPLFQDLKIVGFVRGCNRHLTHILPDAHPRRIERGAAAVKAQEGKIKPQQIFVGSVARN